MRRHWALYAQTSLSRDMDILGLPSFAAPFLRHRGQRWLRKGGSASTRRPRRRTRSPDGSGDKDTPNAVFCVRRKEIKCRRRRSTLMCMRRIEGKEGIQCGSLKYEGNSTRPIVFVAQGTCTPPHLRLNPKRTVGQAQEILPRRRAACAMVIQETNTE